MVKRSNTLLTTSLTTLLVTISGQAIAAQDRTLPVHTIEDLIIQSDNTLSVKNLYGDDSRIVTLDEIPAAENSADEEINVTTSNQAIVNKTTAQIDAEKAMAETAARQQHAEAEARVRAEVESVKAHVDEEINEQSHSDAQSGQAVEATTTTIDDDSIKSIENRNGKRYTTTNLSYYAQQVNSATWAPNMRKNTAMTVKLQTLLDWNHASPGPIDGGWGMNSTKALTNFQAMRGLETTGRMNAETWRELNRNINPDMPILVEYTLTEDDVNTSFTNIPSGSAAKSKLRGLYYQNIREMLGERFHMDVRYLEKLNAGKSYRAGETITVINVGEPLKQTITRVVANKADKTLYAYSGNQLVATYPTTVGSSTTPSPTGTYRIVNKVKMPWYKATVGEGDNEQVYMLPPGPNNPVGVVWMGLSKPSYGIHGSPIPEGISRQASHGCIRLTNWDVLEVYANMQNGATVELK